MRFLLTFLPMLINDLLKVIYVIDSNSRNRINLRVNITGDCDINKYQRTSMTFFHGKLSLPRRHNVMRRASRSNNNIHIRIMQQRFIKFHCLSVELCCHLLSLILMTVCNINFLYTASDKIFSSQFCHLARTEYKRCGLIKLTENLTGKLNSSITDRNSIKRNACFRADTFSCRDCAMKKRIQYSAGSTLFVSQSICLLDLTQNLSFPDNKRIQT